MNKFDTEHRIVVNLTGSHDNDRGALVALASAARRTVDRERERVIAAHQALQAREDAAVRAAALAGGIVAEDDVAKAGLPYAFFVAETASYQHCEVISNERGFFQTFFDFAPDVRHEISTRQHVIGYRIKPAILDEMKRQAEAEARESEKRLTVAQIAAVMCDLERRANAARKPAKGGRRPPFELSAPEAIRAKAIAFDAAANELFPVTPRA